MSRLFTTAERRIFSGSTFWRWGWLALTIACGAANPRPGAKTYIVIAGGGTPQAALAAQQVFVKSPPQILSTAEIALSDTIGGLNPGFHIAVIGYCADPTKADLLVKLTRSVLPGAYKKAIPKPAKVPPSPRITPLVNPFAGRPTPVAHLGFAALNDSADTSGIWEYERSSAALVLQNPRASFSKHRGILHTPYYLSWIQPTSAGATKPYLGYLPAAVLMPQNPGEGTCTQKTVRKYMLGESQAAQTIKKCHFPDGSSSTEESDWEYSKVETRTKMGRFTWMDFLLAYSQDDRFEALRKYPLKLGENHFGGETILVGAESVQICSDGELSCVHLEQQGDEVVYWFEAGA